VTNEGRSIACPLCGKDIVVDDLQGGRNTCPACRGSFICEGS
jgi:Zn-finger nucleic acid-binding protein